MCHCHFFFFTDLNPVRSYRALLIGLSTRCAPSRGLDSRPLLVLRPWSCLFQCFSIRKGESIFLPLFVLPLLTKIFVPDQNICPGAVAIER